MVTQLCSLLEACLGSTTKILTTEMTEAIFIECLVWSVGGLLIEEDRERFDNVVKKLSEMTLINTVAQPINVNELPGNGRILYDFHFDLDDVRWNPWQNYVSNYSHKPNLKFHQILVPTLDTMRHYWLIDKVSSIKKPCLIVGQVGTAKTVTMQYFLHQVSPEKNLILNMNFSSRTSSINVQRNLEANVEKRTKDTYGPTAGKRLLVFVDGNWWEL